MDGSYIFLPLTLLKESIGLNSLLESIDFFKKEANSCVIWVPSVIKLKSLKTICLLSSLIHLMLHVHDDYMSSNLKVIK